MIQGKVRDIYDEGDTLLLVSTNRLTAFDRYMCDIPCKGRVLNQLSAWWLHATRHIIPNHYLSMPEPNSMRVKKCRVLPIEVIVRGYITGSTNTSLWTLYQQGERNVFGCDLPEGLRKNEKLARPILTPTTKSHDHDRPLSRDDLAHIPGLTPLLWQEIETAALALFQFATEVVEKKGLILADTKYEFGFDDNNTLYLIDEVHTPDSSRYWDVEDWKTALVEERDPASYDKEILRLWYRERCDPYTVKDLPEAPQSLIDKVKARYRELYTKITGSELECAE